MDILYLDKDFHYTDGLKINLHSPWEYRNDID